MRRSILSTSSQTEESSLSLRTFPVARKCCASLISVVDPSGIHDTTFSSNMKNDVYIRKELYVNVVLSSVSTMFHEIVERMTNEPTASAPLTTRSRWLLHQSESIRYGSVEEDLEGQVR